MVSVIDTTMLAQHFLLHLLRASPVSGAEAAKDLLPFG